MTTFISKKLEGMIQSDIRQMTRECNRVEGINLGQGVCNMPTPPLVRDGAIDAIRERKSMYSLPEGIPELREAIAKIDPLLATVAFDDINSTMLKTYDTFLQGGN